MKKFIKIMTGFMNRMAQDHVSAFAAQAAFFILMSFVPFLMLLLPLVTYVSITKDMVVEILLQIMPDAGVFFLVLFRRSMTNQQQLYQSVRFLPSGVRGKACRD